MKPKVFALFLFLMACYASADAKTLQWTRLDVVAHLDADGRLRVQERHSIIFNGDWNGGERTFRKSATNVLRLERISRIDASGHPVPLSKDKKLKHVDTYSWHDSNTLRWRSRLPSDPPFNNQEITYVLDYTYAYILIPTDGSYLLDHNFGLPDLEWPIDSYSLVFSIDPVWQPPVPKHIVRSNLPRGENVTINAQLQYTGAGVPAAVNVRPSASFRYALLAVLLAAPLVFAWLFIRGERAHGRFEPLADPASIDRRWLDEHLFKFPPEVVGAAWDDRTGAAEVAAVVARLVQEGKLSSRIEKGGIFKSDDLVLTLLQERNSLQGYERSLVDALFVAGDTTSTRTIREHYAKKGFDPVSKIRTPLEQKARAIGRQGNAPKIDRKPTSVLILAGVALLVLGGLSSPLNIPGGIVGGAILLVLYLVGLGGALDYRRRVSNLGVAALEFVPAILLIMLVPAILLAGVLDFPFSRYTLGGLVLLSLAAIRSIFNLAKSRDAGERLETRRRLAAARDYFVRELRRPNPTLEDAWFPYLLAFGLGTRVDRWFRSFGGTSSFGTTAGGHAAGGGGAPQSSSWTGGGGAFGGAGASGTWAVAAAGMAAGVATPSSGGSGGGGGGGGGGGSSGGGGGGGW